MELLNIIEAVFTPPGLYVFSAVVAIGGLVFLCGLIAEFNKSPKDKEDN